MLGDSELKNLFEKTKLKKVLLKNRFVRSATWESLANKDGSCNSKIKEVMENLAEGEVGLIITGHAYVSPSGQVGLRQLGIYNDSLISSYKGMIKSVHQLGSKIILQISHGGCRSNPQFTNLLPMGPSSRSNCEIKCNAMTLEDIKQVIDDFTKAAIRARKAGFDGIQIHAAHGHLLSQFLSPYFNQREDHYGGSNDNRTRIILEIINNIRSNLGYDYFISVKINSEDFIENGFSIDDLISSSKLLEKIGTGAIELSGGLNIKESQYMAFRTNPLNISEFEEVYYEKAAEQLKKNISIPLILVGGIRSFYTASRLLREGKADYIALSRPLIREPDLVKKWFLGKQIKSQCISCNQCWELVKKDGYLYCKRLNTKRTSCI